VWVAFFQKMIKKNSIWIICLLLLPFIYAHPNGVEVAQKSLRLNYNEYGITAGTEHFSDVWARDGFFASLGSNKIGDYDISKTQLETFIRHQAQNGQIPLRVGDRFIALKFLGLHTKGEYPQYVQDKGKNPALDPNCLFIIAAWDYVNAYGDWSFARTNKDAFISAINWFEQYDTNNNGLVEQEWNGDWADSLRKDGEVLYTNICYYKALNDVVGILEMLEQIEESTVEQEHLQKEIILYTNKAEKVKESLNEDFYNGQYYIDGQKRDWLSTDGNILAILWGVANKEQAKSIIDTIESEGLTKYFSVQSNTPEIPISYVSPFIKFFGLKDYHRQNIIWPWMGAMYCLAKERTYPDQGDMCISKISKVYNEDKIVYEVYDIQGEPLDKLFYNAERNFAWGAGLFIYAHEEIEN